MTARKRKPAAPAKRARDAAPAAIPSRVLVLKVLPPDGKSTNGFEWPRSGCVEAHDWTPEKHCGGGLHGWLWGEGSVQGNLPYRLSALDGTICNPGTHWLVVAVDPADGLVDLSGKVKFRRGEVVHYGDRKSATEYLAANGALGRVIIGALAVSGYGGTSVSGELGTSVSGYGGTSTSGEGGTSVSGYRGTSASGYRGTSVSGYGGTSASGYRGIIQIRHWDNKALRWRLVTGYVGEDGIRPGVRYRLDGGGRFVEDGKKGAGL